MTLCLTLLADEATMKDVVRTSVSPTELRLNVLDAMGTSSFQEHLDQSHSVGFTNKAFNCHSSKTFVASSFFVLSDDPKAITLCWILYFTLECSEQHCQQVFNIKV